MEKQAKIKKAPWKYVKHHLSEDNYNFIDFADGNQLCGCINEPTARLIAAAPELLSACKMLVLSLEELATENKGYNNFIEQGNQAIKKAEGGDA